MNPQAAMTDPQMDAHRKLLGWMPTDSPVMDARYRACLVEGHPWHRIQNQDTGQQADTQDDFLAPKMRGIDKWDIQTDQDHQTKAHPSAAQFLSNVIKKDKADKAGCEG